MSVYVDRRECPQGHTVCRLGEGPSQRGCGCCACCQGCHCHGCSLPSCACYVPRGVDYGDVEILPIDEDRVATLGIVQHGPDHFELVDADRLPRETFLGLDAYRGRPYGSSGAYDANRPTLRAWWRGRYQ